MQSIENHAATSSAIHPSGQSANPIAARPQDEKLGTSTGISHPTGIRAQTYLIKTLSNPIWLPSNSGSVSIYCTFSSNLWIFVSINFDLYTCCVVFSIQSPSSLTLCTWVTTLLAFRGKRCLRCTSHWSAWARGCADQLTLDIVSITMTTYSYEAVYCGVHWQHRASQPLCAAGSREVSRIFGFCLPLHFSWTYPLKVPFRLIIL